MWGSFFISGKTNTASQIQFLHNRIILLQTVRSLSASVGIISVVQTREQTNGKSKLYTTCLGGQHLRNRCRHLTTLEYSKTPVKRCWVLHDGLGYVNFSEHRIIPRSVFLRAFQSTTFPRLFIKLKSAFFPVLEEQFGNASCQDNESL